MALYCIAACSILLAVTMSANKHVMIQMCCCSASLMMRFSKLAVRIQRN